MLQNFIKEYQVISDDYLMTKSTFPDTMLDMKISDLIKGKYDGHSDSHDQLSSYKLKQRNTMPLLRSETHLRSSKSKSSRCEDITQSAPAEGFKKKITDYKENKNVGNLSFNAENENKSKQLATLQSSNSQKANPEGSDSENENCTIKIFKSISQSQPISVCPPQYIKRYSLLSQSTSSNTITTSRSEQNGFGSNIIPQFQYSSSVPVDAFSIKMYDDLEFEKPKPAFKKSSSQACIASRYKSPSPVHIKKKKPAFSSAIDQKKLFQ